MKCAVTVKSGQGGLMTDNQWMIVLHISLLILQALVGIVQYLLSREMKQIRQQVSEALGQADLSSDI